MTEEEEDRTILLSLAQSRDWPPTQKELVWECGINRNRLIKRLDSLEARGLISRKRHTQRTIAITEAGRNFLDK